MSLRFRSFRDLSPVCMSDTTCRCDLFWVHIWLDWTRLVLFWWVLLMLLLLLLCLDLNYQLLLWLWLFCFLFLSGLHMYPAMKLLMRGLAPHLASVKEPRSQTRLVSLTQPCSARTRFWTRGHPEHKRLGPNWRCILLTDTRYCRPPWPPEGTG